MGRIRVVFVRTQFCRPSHGDLKAPSLGPVRVWNGLHGHQEEHVLWMDVVTDEVSEIGAYKDSMLRLAASYAEVEHVKWQGLGLR